MTYQAVVEAGADRIDTALSPFSEGTSQPATETMAMVLQEEGYRVSLDLEKLEEAAGYFRKIKDHYLEAGILDPKMLSPDPRALIYQIPGGMLSNMYSQLKKANAVDKYEAVLKEVPHVRAALGYPPLVTPLSQMVGTQAAMNVITGTAYSMVSNEIKAYLAGEYGKSPVPIADDFRRSIIGDKKVMTDRPADHLKPEFAVLQSEIGSLAKNEEDVLIYALFPKVGKEFLTARTTPKKNDLVIKVAGFL